MHRSIRLAVVSAIVLFCGCNSSSGPQIVPTTGVVRFNGKPLVGARVVFHPASGRPAQATTDNEGKFRLSTLRPSDGAVVGMHQVTVTEARSQVEKMPAAGEQVVTPPVAAGGLPNNYSKPETSGLEYEVKANAKNDFALDLE